MNRLFTFVLIVFVSLLNSFKLPINAQVLPVITNELGDTIVYRWPVSESSLCIKDDMYKG